MKRFYLGAGYKLALRYIIPSAVVPKQIFFGSKESTEAKLRSYS
jgi:hypothetical protein